MVENYQLYFVGGGGDIKIYILSNLLRVTGEIFPIAYLNKLTECFKSILPHSKLACEKLD